MNPLMAGSPVASVYRITSKLNIVWRNTATVVIHQESEPVVDESGRPGKNSPLPMDMPSTITPRAYDHPAKPLGHWRRR